MYIKVHYFFVIVDEYLYILIYVCLTEETERCGKGERVLSTVTATSTACGARRYVNTSAHTDTPCYRIDRTCQKSNSQIEFTI